MMRPKRERVAPAARLAVGAQVEVTWCHDGIPTAFAGTVEVADFTGTVAQYCVRYNDGTGSHWHAAAVVRAADRPSLHAFDDRQPCDAAAHVPYARSVHVSRPVPWNRNCSFSALLSMR